MEPQTPLIPFPARLVLLALAGLLALFVAVREAGVRPAFLREDSIDLRYHELTHRGDQTPPTLVFIGGSDVTGLANAMETRLSSHSVYELSQPNASLLNLLALAEQALRFHPKIILVGLHPLSSRFLPMRSAISILGADRIRPYIPEPLWRFLKAQDTARFEIYFRVLGALRSIDIFPTPMRDWLYDARNAFFRGMSPVPPAVADPYLERHLRAADLSLSKDTPDLLRGLQELVSQHGSQLIVYLPPYSSEAYLVEKYFEQPFGTRVREVLEKDGIRILDYREIFPNTADYFTDAVHPTWHANRLLAEHLLQDLAGAGIPGNPCTADLASSPCRAQADRIAQARPRGPCTKDLHRLCEIGAKERQEDCLWQHFDQLTPACKSIREPNLRYVPCASPRAEFCADKRREEVTACLWQHEDRLSPACRREVAFYLEADASASSCFRERARFCPGLAEPELRLCLAEHLPELNSGCAREVSDGPFGELFDLP